MDYSNVKSLAWPPDGKQSSSATAASSNVKTSDLDLRGPDSPCFLQDISPTIFDENANRDSGQFLTKISPSIFFMDIPRWKWKIGLDLDRDLDDPISMDLEKNHVFWSLGNCFSKPDSRRLPQDQTLQKKSSHFRRIELKNCPVLFRYIFPDENRVSRWIWGAYSYYGEYDPSYDYSGEHSHWACIRKETPDLTAERPAVENKKALAPLETIFSASPVLRSLLQHLNQGDLTTLAGTSRCLRGAIGEQTSALLGGHCQMVLPMLSSSSQEGKIICEGPRGRCHNAPHSKYRLCPCEGPSLGLKTLKPTHGLHFNVCEQCHYSAAQDLQYHLGKLLKKQNVAMYEKCTPRAREPETFRNGLCTCLDKVIDRWLCWDCRKELQRLMAKGAHSLLDKMLEQSTPAAAQVRGHESGCECGGKLFVEEIMSGEAPSTITMCLSFNQICLPTEWRDTTYCKYITLRH